MDCIILKNLKFRGRHGYFPKERREGNDFEVDVMLWVNLERAAKGDELEQTIERPSSRYEQGLGSGRRTQTNTVPCFCWLPQRN